MGSFEQAREEQVERSQAARRQLGAERLDADADARRQCAGGETVGDCVRREPRKVILLCVGPRAEAVLEIDAEVLDRLALQLVDDARMNAVGEREVEPEGLRQRRRGWRVLVERLERGRAELLRDIC